MAGKARLGETDAHAGRCIRHRNTAAYTGRCKRHSRRAGTNRIGSGRRPHTFVNPAMAGKARLG
ncbi:MAG: hypothetical protein K2I34_01260, partial [Paramuribaculum sp.]|nr:hypothetical protein [Paramuribaculum sp.]